MTEITIKDVLGDKEGMIKVDYSKVRKKIEQCKIDKTNQRCREELKNIGIEWID